MSKQKQNFSFIEMLLQTVAPGMLQRRLVTQKQNELIKRQYDAAHPISQSSTVFRNSNTANKEIHNNIHLLRENSRETLRNNPVAVKGQQVIVSNTIGYGIVPQIRHSDPVREQQIKDLWEQWSKSAGADGTDFYSLQSQVMQAVVADGESILRVTPVDGSMRLHLLESDVIKTDMHLSDPIDESHYLENGVVSDQYGRPLKYCMRTGRSSDFRKQTTEFVSSSEVIHVFRKDRPGQNRGVSWFAPVLSTIWSLSEIQHTQLMRLKLASALTAIVTSQPSPLPSELQQQQMQLDWNLEPGSVMRINPGESVQLPNIPNPDGFSEQTKLSLRLIACGLGVTYEALSNDLSNVNFSSARIGDLAFRSNIDQWRHQMFIPQFCERAFQAFLMSCQLRGIDTTGTSVNWVPPIRQMLDPSSEIAAQKDAIRSGLQSYKGALLEYGLDPEKHLKDIADSQASLDRLGIILDSDPRYSGNGQLASGDSLQQIQTIQKANAKP